MERHSVPHSQTKIRVGSKPISAAVVDLNADGHLDLAVANVDSTDISLLLNAGDGKFNRHKPIPVAGVPTAIAAGHLNDDAYPDLVVTTYNSGVFVLFGEPIEETVPVTLEGGGAVYSQDFDSLGSEEDKPGTSLPTGWSCIADGAPCTTITQEFPGDALTAGTYNAGFESDRALATAMVSQSQQNELQLAATVVDADATALRLSFDLEAWGTSRLSSTPAEAAYIVTIEADQGDGFETVADLGRVTTGKNVARPSSAFGPEVWKTDGTNVSLGVDTQPGPTGTQFGHPVTYGGELYFTIVGDDDWGRDDRIYKFDGETLSKVADVVPEHSGVVFQDSLLYNTNANSGTIFVVIDETGVSTVPAPPGTDFAFYSEPQYMTVVGDQLYFRLEKSGWELWKYDGRTVSLAADIRPGLSSGLNPSSLTEFQDQLYFIANDGLTGSELWRFDGTTASQVADMNPGPDGGLSTGTFSTGTFSELNDELYFVANDGVSNTSLWKTDGTVVSRVTDISADTTVSVGSPYTAAFDGAVYFVAEEGDSGLGLWKTDGVTVAAVANPNPHGDFIEGKPRFAVFNGELYFVADDGWTGREVWKTDGNRVTRVSDVNAGPGHSDPYGFAPFGDEAYFFATDSGTANAWIDGNLVTDRTHYDSGIVELDIPEGATLRVRFAGQDTGSTRGLIFGLDNVQLRLLALGDSNGDGQFNQLDIVTVLQPGKYLTAEPADFAAGDWNGDGVFDQQDIVVALQTGHYLQGPYAASSRTGWLAPEGAEKLAVDTLLGLKLELDDLLAPF